MDIHLPDGAVSASDEILFKVKKPGPVPKPPTYRSFCMGYSGSYGMHIKGNLYIPDAEIYALLKEHALDPAQPPCFPSLEKGKPAEFKEFDWSPHGYPGRTQLCFDWKGTACKFWAVPHQSACYVAVYDMTPGAGERVLGEFVTELLVRHKEPPKPAGKMNIYTAQRNPSTGEYSWRLLQERLHRRLDTIYLEKAVKDDLVLQLSTFLASSVMYDLYGVTWKRVFLFHGVPGTGKTSTIVALASHFGQNVAKLTVTKDIDARRVENLFQSLPDNTFLVIEDIVERDGTTVVDFSTLLNCMDGLTTRRGLVAFLTTNFHAKLDEALIRPGRVDCTVEFHLPGVDELRRALEVLAADYKHEHEAFLATCHGMSIAALQKWLFDCVMSKRTSILQ